MESHKNHVPNHQPEDFFTMLIPISDASVMKPPKICGDDRVGVVHAIPMDQTLQGEGHIHDHLKASAASPNPVVPGKP